MTTPVTDRDALIRGYQTRAAAEAVLPNIINGLIVDHGPNVWPQFGIIIAPMIGDAVSYGFNGDYHPDGTIVAISTSLKVITTSTGRKYYRRRETGSWKADGTWTLVRGHRNERNPSF